MNLNVTVIITLVAYVFGAITKVFVNKVPNKYIPLQNVAIGLLSALICFIFHLEPNFLEAVVVCLMATMSAGGISDLIKLKDTLKNGTQDDESDSG